MGPEGEGNFDDGHHGIQEGYHEGMMHEHDHEDPFAELDNHPLYNMQEMQSHLDELSEALHTYDSQLHQTHEENV